MCLNCGCHQTPQWRCGPLGPRTLCNACGVRYKKDLPLNCWPIRDGMVLPPVSAGLHYCKVAGRRLAHPPGWYTPPCPARLRACTPAGLHLERPLPLNSAPSNLPFSSTPKPACPPLPSPRLQGAQLPPGFVVPPGITIHTQPGDFD